MSEERWIAPGSKCDCCGRAKRDDESSWTEEHATMGGSGFNFSWCPTCEKDQEATGKIIMDCLSAWRKHCEFHWKSTPGAKVRMSEALKQELIANGCAEHTEEFFDCIGIVEGPVDYGETKGPEVDVRWQPSNLRYGYHPDQLVFVFDKPG